MKRMQIVAVNEWWTALEMDVKSIITGIYDKSGAEMFWQNLSTSDRQNIYRWQQAEAGNAALSEEEKHSLLMEIVCELADTALVSEYGIPLDDMSDENGSFYEEYQDRFNDLYDEIEELLLTINQ